MDCGPSCLRMVAAHYGQHYALQTLRERCHIDREGVSLQGVSLGAESIGLRTMAVKLPLQSSDPEMPSLYDVPLPCMAHWKQQHFVLVYDINDKHVFVADPAHGKVKMSLNEFKAGWISDAKSTVETGILLLFETTPEFYQLDDEPVERAGFGLLWRYLKVHKGLWTQLIIGLLIGSLLQLAFPFLTQAVVDVGIEQQNLHFVYIVLAAQLMLFLGQTGLAIIRSWMLLHIGQRINIALISDFLMKLMRLPISYFDSKHTGDLLQRIQDHYRIEAFLTASTLNILFSAITLLVFGIVLLLYNPLIFAIFILSAMLYTAWILFFMRRRKTLDYKKFQQMSANQSSLIQLINGMQDIKLHNSEQQKRWEWERIQVKLFRLNVQSLALDQTQEAGGSFINELKNIIITFVSAYAVIKGQMSLGAMLAVQYIIGQLNGPLTQLVNFFRAAQDAKISLERLSEIYKLADEKLPDDHYANIDFEGKDLKFENVSFRYNELSAYALQDINLHIPAGKVTAIVGSSGSGKTTLLKLLLKFYDVTSGSISLGETPLKAIEPTRWRDRVGTVMQDGFIFSDTIAKNIALGQEQVDKHKLLKAVQVANIQAFIESMPLGYNTKIGGDGVGLSQGQKQRILIARAVYKNPDFIYFDEATNALDANNERQIMANLEDFFAGRTVIIVAHRLSTVKNADQIIVLDQGKLIEQGKHEDLIAQRGAYYTLIKNQLELGD